MKRLRRAARRTLRFPQTAADADHSPARSQVLTLPLTGHEPASTTAHVREGIEIMRICLRCAPVLALAGALALGDTSTARAQATSQVSADTAGYQDYRGGDTSAAAAQPTGGADSGAVPLPSGATDVYVRGINDAGVIVGWISIFRRKEQYREPGHSVGALRRQLDDGVPDRLRPG